jgi:hypothetical protein
MLEDLIARALELGQGVRRAGKSNRTRTQSYFRLISGCERTYLELGGSIWLRDEAHLLGAATRADSTLWYASKVPEELLANPNTLRGFRAERTTRKDHCLHRCEVPSSGAGTLAGYLGREVRSITLEAEGSLQR